MSAHIDAELVQAALQMAVGRRQSGPGLLYHIDRGSQYACWAYQGLLAAQGIRCSMSRKGECLDNAVAERFFGSLKGERTAHRIYATRQDARADVIEISRCFITARGYTRTWAIAAPMIMRQYSQPLNSVAVFP